MFIGTVTARNEIHRTVLSGYTHNIRKNLIRVCWKLRDIARMLQISNLNMLSVVNRIIVNCVAKCWATHCLNSLPVWAWARACLLDFPCGNKTLCIKCCMTLVLVKLQSDGMPSSSSFVTIEYIGLCEGERQNSPCNLPWRHRGWV